MHDDEFHHHWLAYWKPLALSCLLAVLGAAGILIWPAGGMLLLASAVIVAAGVYMFWSWHTFRFTPDNRLIRRRGFFRCTEDIISLFGVLTPYQIPILGSMLDVGNVHLGIPGPDIDIRHIANFHAFYDRLVASTRPPHRGPDPPVVQVFFQMPAMARGARHWNDRLPPG